MKNKIKEMVLRIRNHFSSIAYKIFFNMVFCMVILLLFNWLLNDVVLEQYYRREKATKIEAVFSEIDDIYSNTPSREERQLQLDVISGKNNYTTVIFDNHARVMYFSAGGFTPELSDQIRERFWGEIKPTLTAGSYEIRTVRDSRVESEYLSLVGTLSNGSFVLVHSPLQAVNEGVEIANSFLIFSGILTGILSCFLMIVLTRRLIRPIRELMNVTESLAQMDFSRKYEGKGNDELSRMGRRINKLGMDIEQNLSELKTLNAQLERDNEIKTKQDQLRRDFIANASHELKTPIALIRAYAEGISEDVSSDTESRKAYCEIIQDEADKMNMLIKKMTSLMQLESGEEELTISRFQITELIEGVLRNYSILLDRKKITVSFTYSEDLYCWGDEYFIENVINNYISNAANHVSEKGEIIVTAEKRSGEDGKSRVHVNVFNTGDNIAEEDIVRIWESFYKADKARTRQYGGTGLGLSVVSAIMRAHNMPCGVENEENGVSFWFELELA